MNKSNHCYEKLYIARTVEPALSDIVKKSDKPDYAKYPSMNIESMKLIGAFTSHPLGPTFLA